MASTVFQLTLTTIVVALRIATAIPTHGDEVSLNAVSTCQMQNQKFIVKTTITPSPYHESQKATYPRFRTEVRNRTATKHLYDEVETETSESTTRAAHCSFKEAADVELGALLDTGKDAMVTLVAGASRLIAHKAVLAARSSVFTAMLCDSTQEASSSELAIPDVEGPVLRQLVAYLYTLQAPQLPSVAPQLLAAADMFSLFALKAECEAQVATQLSVETAVATAVLAMRHTSTRLRQTAIEFIKAHLNHVMASQGWYDAMHYQLDDFIELNRLLSELPVETSTPATADTQPTTVATSSLRRASQAQTPVAAASLSPPTSPPEEDAVSFLRSLPSEEKGRRLIKAAKKGRVKDVEVLLAVGADMGARDRKGRTAMRYAAEWGHVEVARRLLEAGAEVDARDRGQRTPLYWAASNGHTAVVRLLLEYAANPNAKDEGDWTALHMTALRGRAEVVAVLLQAGADSEATDKKGRTPLYYARQYSHQDVIQLLIRSYYSKKSTD